MKYLISMALIAIFICSCKKSFYETPPLGQLSTEQLKTKDGVEKILIGAYTMLQGAGAGASPMNWLYGDVASDDGTAGIAPTDFDRFTVNALNADIDSKWRTMYEGVERANDVLRVLPQVANIDDNNRKRIAGEARFLRGYFYFELRKIFFRVPYIDENAVIKLLPNNDEMYPKIEDDFKFAGENLPDHYDSGIGRANSWAAKAFLAKVYMYQNKFNEAKPLLADIIANGRTSNNIHYGLEDCFRDAFNVEKKNGRESVFAIQTSINDGSGNAHANNANRETYPRIPEAGLFYGANFNATQDLVDVFKTDSQGLPLFTTYSLTHLKNDDGLYSEDPYTPDTTTSVDPRLDWTVSRRGIPYLGWGKNPGVKWNGGYGLPGGSLFPVKNMFTKAQAGVFSATDGDKSANSSNYTLIRFADVLLWAAECEVESGSLETAREIINKIRRRAKNGCYVMSQSNIAMPASNYNINEYTTSFANQNYGRQALRFERRLEFGLEGQRHFDLVRWGIAKDVINRFLTVESARFYKSYLANYSFVNNKNEYFPIPQVEIVNSSINGVSVLKQNPGY